MIGLLLVLVLGLPTQAAERCATEISDDVRRWFHQEMTPVEQNRLTRILDSGKWPKMVRFLDRRGLFDQPHCPANTAALALTPEGRDLLIRVFRSYTGHSERPGLFQGDG